MSNIHKNILIIMNILNLIGKKMRYSIDLNLMIRIYNLINIDCEPIIGYLIPILYLEYIDFKQNNILRH